MDGEKRHGKEGGMADLHHTEIIGCKLDIPKMKWKLKQSTYI